MATYYGQVKGNRDTAATRTGSKNSGIKASVQSYSGSIIVSLYNGKCEIEISKESSFYGKMVFSGTIQELEKVLTGGKEKC